MVLASVRATGWRTGRCPGITLARGAADLAPATGGRMGTPGTAALRAGACIGARGPFATPPATVPVGIALTAWPGGPNGGRGVATTFSAGAGVRAADSGADGVKGGVGGFEGGADGFSGGAGGAGAWDFGFGEAAGGAGLALFRGGRRACMGGRSGSARPPAVIDGLTLVAGGRRAGCFSIDRVGRACGAVPAFGFGFSETFP